MRIDGHMDREMYNSCLALIHGQWTDPAWTWGIGVHMIEDCLACERPKMDRRYLFVTSPALTVA